ncbi:hypothetical protein ACEPPZ_11960 [Paracoccus yeei]|uniref:DUF7220 family protein n=1 Tax=Paracoccus yeei TaxID=147645 RepID=UPI0028D4C23C|nr:hypothetical protein [Paracoccus yeei]
MSLIEAATNVIVRYALAVGMQIAVFPVFGIHVALADQLAIGLAFTGLSLVRGATSGRLTTSTKTPNVSNADKGCIRCGCADGCFRFGAPIGHCSRSRRLVRIALAGINSVGCRGK